MSIRLRDYQNEAVDAVRADLADGVTRPAVVLPTGGGKTIVFSALGEAERSRGKTLIVAHRDELINQAADKYRSVNPGADVGIVKAERDDHEHAVIVSSVQTLARPNRRGRISGVGLGIIDECHHATAKSYLDVMDHFGVPFVGFTATLARGDGKALGEVWQKISYEMPLLRMIRRGYLTDVKGIRIKVPDLDLKGLRKTAGDYREGELGERLAESMAPVTVARAYREHGVREDGTVRPGILFAPTVATAQIFAEAMTDEGFRCEAIWGDMPMDDRRRVLREFDEGKIDILSNCMVLTEGFDSPRAEVAVIARPTQSAPLYVQMVGRVLRLYPGKSFALVLDVVGAATNHELCTLATLSGDRLGEIKETSSLLKALDELEAAEAEAVDEADSLGYVGDVVSETVDLFAGSRQSWLQTHGGHWFIPAGGRIIALVPDRVGRLDVAWFEMPSRDNNWKPRGGGYVVRGIADFGIAMAHGEGEITWEEEVMAAKDRAWRKKKRTQAQVDFARRLGMRTDQIPESMRAGQLGDLISIELASRRIDRLVERHLAGRR
ncbi:MAG TPA: DEAD/DEAH box helicase [Candidatus Limnocylindrales bacterium]